MKNAKRNVIVSAILTIALCFSLMIGGTYAWFTDSAKISVNKIVSGTLKVGLNMWDEENEQWVDANGKTLSFIRTDAEDEDNGLWAPGYKFKLPKLQVVNKGNLRLKYKLEFNGMSDSLLLDELNIDMNGMEFRGYILATEYVELEAGASIDDIPVTIVFPKEATGGKNITCNLVIKVEAQQGNAVATNDVDVPDGCVLVKETKDGANWYSVVSAAALNDGIEETVDFASTLAVSEGNMTINATNKTIENTNDLWESKPNAWSLVSARETANVTVMGGNFKAKENDCYAVDVQDGATVEINGGTFIGNIHAVYVYEGTAYIKGGFYSVQQKYPDANKANEFVLNCYDANRANGTAKIIVTGGTFVNFNPANCQAEGANTNFVADGYKVVSETKANGDVWYTVVKA